jgi:hypothetical protein
MKIGSASDTAEEMWYNQLSVAILEFVAVKKSG